MNDRQRLLICSQVLPGAFLMFTVITLIISIAVPAWYFTPGGGWEYITSYSLNPDRVVTEFAQGIQFVVFFSLCGLFYAVLFSFTEPEESEPIVDTE